MDTVRGGASLIINIVFDAYIYVLLLRLILQKVGASWNNSVVQFLFKLTEPVIKPLRRFLPGFKGFDLAIVVLMLVVEIVELWMRIGLKIGAFPSIIGTLVIAVGELGMKTVYLFLYATIIGAIMSWVPSLARNQLAEIIQMLTRPLLAPIRRFLPTVGGFDLSPVVAVVILLLINVIIVGAIINLGLRLAF